MLYMLDAALRARQDSRRADRAIDELPGMRRWRIEHRLYQVFAVLLLVMIFAAAMWLLATLATLVAVAG